MAKVWFVRRRGAQWIAPGGRPAHEAPLAQLVFPLDIGPQRWLPSERPVAAPEVPREEFSTLKKVMIESDAADLAGQESTTYRIGYYDSPYPPAEAVRRLGILPGREGQD